MKKNSIKKSLVSFGIILTMVTSLAGCGGGKSTSDKEGSAGSDKTYTIKLDMPVPMTSSWGVGAEKFASEIKEKTNGKYTVKVYSDSQLAGGSQAKALEMLQSGDIDVTIHGVLTWAAGDVRISMPALPWLFKSWEEATAAMNGAGGDMVKEVVKETGAVPLAFGISGFRQLFNNVHPVTTPAELKGLKIRVPGNAMYIDLFKALGADPVAMNASELYTALQQGAVDGQENPADMTITQKFCEVLKYMTAWNYSCEPTILSTSNKLWDKLTEEEKRIFEEAAKVAMEAQVKAAKERDGDYMKKLEEEYKIKVVTLNDSQINEFKKLAQPIYDKYRTTMGEEMYKAFGIK